MRTFLFLSLLVLLTSLAPQPTTADLVTLLPEDQFGQSAIQVYQKKTPELFNTLAQSEEEIVLSYTAIIGGRYSSVSVSEQDPTRVIYCPTDEKFTNVYETGDNAPVGKEVVLFYKVVNKSEKNLTLKLFYKLKRPTL